MFQCTKNNLFAKIFYDVILFKLHFNKKLFNFII